MNTGRYTILHWVGVNGEVFDRPPPEVLKSLDEIYAMSTGDDRFVIVRSVTRRIMGIDLHDVIVLSEEPWLDITPAVAHYKAISHAVVACVIKSQKGDHQYAAFALMREQTVLQIQARYTRGRNEATLLALDMPTK